MRSVAPIRYQTYPPMTAIAPGAATAWPKTVPGHHRTVRQTVQTSLSNTEHN